VVKEASGTLSPTLIVMGSLLEVRRRS